MEKLCGNNFDNASVIHEIAGNIMVPQLWEISFNIFGCFFGIFKQEIYANQLASHEQMHATGDIEKCLCLNSGKQG